MTPAQEGELAREARRWIERIRLGSGRRYRVSPRGRLYLRRLFRDNLRHGGVPWQLPRRRRRPRRSRVVLLIDVSWSTARAAGLILSMAREVLHGVRRTRVLLFVDRPVDATTAVEGWLQPRPVAAASQSPGPPRAFPGAGIVGAGESFAGFLARVPGLNLDAPSDYGRVFDRLRRASYRPSGRNTVWLILGDGRTNRFDPQAWCFEEIAERCGAVLWLVPEPLARWSGGDSALADYLPSVDIAVEAGDLQGLARGVREMVRRL